MSQNRKQFACFLWLRAWSFLCVNRSAFRESLPAAFKKSVNIVETVANKSWRIKKTRRCLVHFYEFMNDLQSQRCFQDSDCQVYDSIFDFVFNSPENIWMRKFVEELNFAQHVGSIGSELIHFEHHHLTGHSVCHLGKEKDRKGC